MFAGGVEILVVLVLIAVFFGAGKLPEVMEAMGHGYKQFRESSDELSGLGEELRDDRAGERRRPEA